MKSYDAQIRDVLVTLVEVYPYGKTAAELREECGFPHGQRAGGILRRLSGQGLVVGELIMGERHWWAERAAVEAYRIFVESPELEAVSVGG